MNLRELRRKKGFTRSFISNQLGITGDHLNVIERGKIKLSFDKAKKLSLIYDLEVQEILKLANNGGV